MFIVLAMSGHASETRRIYHAQHERISNDETAFNRIQGLYEGKTFGLPADWFRGKRAVDFGCGNVGSLLIRLHELGVRQIVGLDIGHDWIAPLEKNLKANSVPMEKVTLGPGSVLDRSSFEDGRFDFVSVNGVLIHLERLEDIPVAFAEAARVTAKGGALYTSWGPCGGLVQGVIMPALRKHYRENAEFRAFIDRVSPDELHGVIDKIVADTEAQTGELLPAKLLKALFGTDYCVFLQNFIQAPTWWSNECTPAFVEDLYRGNGFSTVTRLRSYAKRTDIRKFFAPLHYDIEHSFSRLLYGEGYVQYVGQK